MFGPAALSDRSLTRLARGGRLRRIAVIGSAQTSLALRRELRLAGEDCSEVIGRIAFGDDTGGDPEMPVIGRLGQLDQVVAANRIDLLVLSGEAPRIEVFDEALAAADRSIRICELSDFYEAVFAHVPTAEINACWFDYLVHPCYRDSAKVKRFIDVAGALIVGLAALPLIAVAALLIRRDGGPAFFSQVRVGEGGRPITIHKLRTMRPGTGDAAQWSSSDDPRVTSIGRFLRRTHLDELPQLINVLRGEMSLVGPRPEQPEFVRRLERDLPFYQRRHLIKPGITGWAQIRCGYAGSDIGSAWKLCHDLFYMKYRSLKLDFAIMLRTATKMFFEHQADIGTEPAAVFVAAAAMPTTASGLPDRVGSTALGLELRRFADHPELTVSERELICAIASVDRGDRNLEPTAEPDFASAA